ncbi:survival protein SurA precursor [Vibrio astriarenae]|nr:survival protein SurA precursor [Vibrio sp. C7]
MTVNSSVALHYQCLKLSHEKFALNMNELNDAEQAHIQKLARQTVTLQNKVCAAPEAKVINVSDGDVAEAVKQLVDQCGDIYQFQLTLSKHKLDENDLRRILKQQLVVDAVLDHVSQDIPELAHQDAYDYYLNHSDKFSRARAWDVSQILLTINDDYPENTLKEAKKRIHQLYDTVTVDTFSTTALRHSECPSAMEGGRLGWCESGKLFGELESVLQWLPKNMVSAPIRSEIGFHILVCHAEKPPMVASFEEALPSIRELHEKRARHYMQREWIKKL